MISAKGRDFVSEREELALLLWNCGAIKISDGELPLCWNGEKALLPGTREKLLDALENMAREHYAAAEAVLGGEWARLLSERLGLPLNPAELPSNPLVVEPVIADGEDLLRLAAPIRESGKSVAAAALFQFGLESARQRLDKADVRIHWLTDLETAAAVGLQQGLLDFDAYDALLSIL